MEKVKVKWLGNTPADKGGVTWGVPWKKGTLKKNTYERKRTSLQVAKLEFEGGSLRCDRDTAFDFYAFKSYNI